MSFRSHSVNLQCKSGGCFLRDLDAMIEIDSSRFIYLLIHFMMLSPLFIIFDFAFVVVLLIIFFIICVVAVVVVLF